MFTALLLTSPYEDSRILNLTDVAGFLPTQSNTNFLCEIILAIVVKTMRRISPVLIVLVFLMQSAALMVAPTSHAASARGGSNDDFTIWDITFGQENMSTWVQSDGTIQPYTFQDKKITISVNVKRLGNSQIEKTTNATLEIVHPIGFVMETFSWTTEPMTGGQEKLQTLTWTPTAAHSILNTTTNDLSGGLILRGTVSYPLDDRNTNDILDEILPIAVSSDPFDGTKTSFNDLTFLSGKYPADGGGATGQGSWVEDSNNAAVGTKHWRHSTIGSNYPSNAEATRLFRGYKTNTPQCDVDSQGDGELPAYYGWYICRSIFYSSNYVSSQFHIQAWGSMATGDYVALELWRGSGTLSSDTESLRYDLANGNPSPASGQWTNISWDPQETWKNIPGLASPEIFLGGNAYHYGLVFFSDSSVASEGMHVDDFIHFGVSKVNDYTINLTCDNPTGGYTLAPSEMATLHCFLTNNGYSPISLRAETNVSNESWMYPVPSIRFDIESSNNHNVNVVMPPINGGKTIEIWANLTVPAGADVQQQSWLVWFTDASGSQLGEKARLELSLGVTEQYGVALTSTSGLVAATIPPNEYGHFDFKLQNTGNKDAAFNLGSTFSDTEAGWTYNVENDTGVVIPNPIILDRGERIDLTLNISAPEFAQPGTVSFNLRATCPSCSTALFGTDIIVRNIEVPIIREVFLETEEDSFSSSANGIEQTKYINIYNLGNSDESYNLDVSMNNWMFGAYLPTDSVSGLDAWDGDVTVPLKLPMPIGLSPGIYTVTVTATNNNDTSVKDSISLSVEILDTASVHVSDEDTGQSYIPGQPAQTMQFMVRNDGNSIDRFDITLDYPENKMMANVDENDNEMVGTRTIEIAPGASVNVSISFSFLDDIDDGQIMMNVIATSVNDNTISSSGAVTFLVGSQNWLKLIPSAPLTIDNADDDYEVVVTVRNQYTSAQVVSMDLDDSETKNWFQSRIDSADRNFVLGVGEEREITIELEISETTLAYLNDEGRLVVNLTIWAQSETVSDAAKTSVQITMIQLESSNTDGEVDETEGGFDGVFNIILWIVLALVLGGGGFYAFRIIQNTGEEEDEYGGWGRDMYEDNLAATYGAVAEAPTIGAMGVMPSPEKSLADIPSAMPPESSFAPAAPEPIQDGPALPPGGLPEGWTMEQWKHYGQQWLEQNGLA